jgi:hypothetical protein
MLDPNKNHTYFIEKFGQQAYNIRKIRDSAAIGGCICGLLPIMQSYEPTSPDGVKHGKHDKQGEGEGRQGVQPVRSGYKGYTGDHHIWNKNRYQATLHKEPRKYNYNFTFGES